MDQFVYDSLPTPTSIRLLRREGRSGSRLLNFSLVIADLEDKPIYHCLSYTWGNPHSNAAGFEQYFDAHATEYAADKQYPVLCNGKILKIGRNLHDAMEQLPRDCYRRHLREKDILAGNSTYLHIAVKRGLCKALSGQIENGADISAQDASGKTPLHLAVLHNQLDAARALLDAGADPNIRDNEQKRPVTYSWGNRDIGMTLLLVSRMLNPVRTALFKTYGNPDDLIWIDSICINQNDVKERSSQVSRMQQIYECAEFVLAWLGNADPSTELAIETIFKLGQSEESLSSTDIKPYEYTPREVYEASGIPYISIESWNVLARLLTRQWFRRIWVIQEVVLASSIIMYCGRYKIRFDMCSSVCNSLNELYSKTGRYHSTRYLVSDAQLEPIEHFLSLMSELRLQNVGVLQFGRQIGQEEVKRRLERSFSLPRLILDAVAFSATDPRDKIYALLPLSQLNPKNPYTRFPDYSLDVETCYMYATLEILLNSDNFDILSWVQTDSPYRRSGLPSWVPDYSLGELQVTMWSRYKRSTVKHREPLFFGVERLLERPNLGMLGISGYDFDTIACIGGAGHPDKQEVFTLDPGWFELGLSLDIEYHTGQSRTESLWRTLCADQKDYDAHPAPPYYKTHFKRLLCAMFYTKAEQYLASSSDSFLETWNAFGESLQKMGSNNQGAAQELNKLKREHRALSKMLHLSDTEALDPYFSESHTPSLTELETYFQNRGSVSPQMNKWIERGYSPSVSTEALNPFGIVHASAHTGTRLFVTKGKYIGLGPLSMREGDSVFLIPTAKVPLIFRQVCGQNDPLDSRRKFTLVGEAYVHGIMRGEAITRHPELEEKFERIYLI